MKLRLFVYEGYNLVDLGNQLSKDGKEYGAIDTPEITLTYIGNEMYSAIAIFKCADEDN